MKRAWFGRRIFDGRPSCGSTQSKRSIVGGTVGLMAGRRGRTGVGRVGAGLVVAGAVLAACAPGGRAGVGPTTTTAGGCPRHLPADELCAGGPSGGVEGTLEATGGPAPGLPRPVSGSVVVTGPGATTTRVHVGADGSFTLHLAGGTYTVSGRTGDQSCVGRTIHVDPASHINVLVVCPME